MTPRGASYKQQASHKTTRQPLPIGHGKTKNHTIMDSEAISAKSVAELRQEREQEHRKEDEEYHKDIEAIERVTRMLAGRKRASVATGIAGADQSKTPVQSGSNNKSGCSPSKAVRASIAHCPKSSQSSTFANISRITSLTWINQRRLCRQHCAALLVTK